MRMNKFISAMLAMTLTVSMAGALTVSADRNEEIDELIRQNKPQNPDDVTIFDVSTPKPTEKVDYKTENGLRFYCEDYSDGIRIHIVKTPADKVIIPETVDGKVVRAVKFESSTGGTDGALQFKSISFPDTINYIDVMMANKLLESVCLPASLTKMVDRMFYGCAALTTVEIPESITKISPNAFNGCTSLKKVKLPEGLIAIGEKAFSSSGIENINIPSSVAKIDNNAFHVCRSLKSVNIPDRVTYIGDSAFSGTAITSVTIPENIEYLGKYAFSNCKELADVRGVSKDRLIKCWDAFSNTAWRDSLKLDDPFLVDASGTLIAYAGNDSDIVIPNNVKVIGEHALSYNDNITKVTIPDSVTKISEAAFAYCHNITDITIPASVTKIESFAFSHCTNLKNVTLKASDTPLEVSGISFQYTKISPDTLKTNGRKYRNQGVVFKETAFDPEYMPIEESNPTEAPMSTVVPAATAAPTETISPTKEPKDLVVTNDDGNVSIATDGKMITFDDSKPFIDANGRTQIPIRAVAEALDCVVDWDGETHTVTISKDNIAVIIKIGDSNMQVGKKIVTMDTTAQIVNDRTYIPVRFVGEALGMTVNWISE